MSLNALTTAAATFLGPVRVMAVDGPEIRVELRRDPEAEPEIVAAQMALAFPYIPAVDDLLLVIGDETTHYIIGVLRGRGQAKLAIPGNVEIRAVGGTLDLSGDRGVTISAPETTVRTGRYTLFAQTVMQSMGSMFSRVLDVFTLHAGKSRRVIDDDDYSQAKNTTIVSAENSKLYGKTVHLGH